MFLGLRRGRFRAGIFHLMTHAFFKGLLFLAAGSVIHAMGGEQDMRKMGGLRTKIPDHVLDACSWPRWPSRARRASPDFSARTKFWKRAGPFQSLVLLAGRARRGLTSFYMFRLIFLTFFGEPRYDEHHVHVHESPRNMTVPLIVLAILSAVGGWMAAPHLVGGTEYFEQFLAPVFAAYAAAQGDSVTRVLNPELLPPARLRRVRAGPAARAHSARP